MKCAGIDIGSRTIELVILEQDEIIKTKQVNTGYNPIKKVKKILDGVKYDTILATGYGRNLFEQTFGFKSVTEIKAYAVGVKKLFPEVGVIIDIGGQDSKVISLFSNGKIRKFEMNDRCAAGTGKFLEVMSKALGYSMDEFGKRALEAKNALKISSMCTVFAESEVISMIARGISRSEIALGLHMSVINRIIGMFKRMPTSTGKIVFAGGVAKNVCVIDKLSFVLEREINIPENPQTAGALGAATLASQLCS